MKIGFDGRFIRGGQTGNGVFTQLLLEGLARLDDENEYTVYLLEDVPFIQKPNFSLRRMSRLHANSHLRFLLTFPIELYRNPVDIFHAIYTVPLRTQTKTVLTLVEFSWFIHPEEFPASKVFLSELRVMTRRSLQRADRIIIPTKFWRDKLLEHFDVPKEKVEVIHFGYNEEFLSPCTVEEIASVKQKFGISQNYLLSVGDLHPRKNLGRLIEAFNWLKEARKIPFQLVLVGKEHWKAKEIQYKAVSSSAHDSILFTGYVPLDELRALYQGATLFAFPSLDEGFGLPVHEAMASRLPVVVSNRGALPEVAGDAALIVDPLSIEDIGSAILKVLEDVRLREELIEKGIKQIQGFSWDESCRKLLKVYDSLRGEPSPKRWRN
jgi:glycosyltransferase involved in cell wall biosynthesis